MSEIITTNQVVMGMWTKDCENHAEILELFATVENSRNKLEAENKILREAVEFYADKGNWDYRDCWMDVDSCGGKRARTALEKIKEF